MGRMDGRCALSRWRRSLRFGPGDGRTLSARTGKKNEKTQAPLFGMEADTAWARHWTAGQICEPAGEAVNTVPLIRLGPFSWYLG